MKAAKIDWKVKMETKTCSITDDEIHELLSYHGRNLGSGLYTDEKVERINYLNRRLKAEKKDKTENQPKNNEINQALVLEPKVATW